MLNSPAMKKALLFWVTVCSSLLSFSQTVLSAGEAVVTSFNSDGDDDFSFVLLKDVVAGTEIKFTENAWHAGALKSNEGTITWTASGAVNCGTEISVDQSASTATTGTIVKTGSWGLAVGGDQILVYQGASGSPTFIFAADIGRLFDAKYKFNLLVTESILFT